MQIDQGKINYLDRNFEISDLSLPHPNGVNGSIPVHMVLGCVDESQSRIISQRARELRIPVNCADIPELYILL